MKALNCPNCNEPPEVLALANKTGCFVSCKDPLCGVAGPTLPTLESAVRWWNKFVTRGVHAPAIMRAALKGNQELIESYADLMDEMEGTAWRQPR